MVKAIGLAMFTVDSVFVQMPRRRQHAEVSTEGVYNQLIARLEQCSTEIADLSCEVQRLSNRRSWHVGAVVLNTIIILGLAIYLYTARFIISPEQMKDAISDRLLLYTKDQTGMRNCAHPFQGADIIHPFTSGTYSVKNAPAGIVSWQPEIVIGAGVQAGRCWSFAGSDGHLGIALSEAVVVTNITVEHISADLASQPEVALCNMIIWGFSEDDAALEWYRQSIAHHRIASFSFPVPPAKLHNSMPFQNFVPIASFTYDVYSCHFLQMFETLEEVHAVDLAVRALIVHVQSNWGSTDRTCLYRIRVHGRNISL